MLVQIHLFKNGSSSIPESYFVNSTSKELALNALVVKNNINLDRYSFVLVCDLTLSIIQDDVLVDEVKAVIDNDFNSPTLDVLKSYAKR